ncbi:MULTISPECIES: BrnT family toxin [Methylobacterium]|uniref:BrnT family toxin n=1 Tax=Methylobacterium TaxID=407 RepID=UPI000764CB39
MSLVRIEWDDGNREKCQKHGVSIAEIEDVLRGRPRIAPDLKHSATEQRLIAIGRTPAGRSIFVAFTIRQYGDEMSIRPISARSMHRKEVASCEHQDS